MGRVRENRKENLSRHGYPTPVIQKTVIKMQREDSLVYRMSDGDGRMAGKSEKAVLEDDNVCPRLYREMQTD